MAAGFPQTVFKAAAQSTKQTAISAARAVAQQSRETLQTAKEQVGLPTSETPQQPERSSEAPQVVQQVQADGPEVIDREAIASRERAMLAELESRLAQIRARRSQEIASYTEQTQVKMDTVTQPTPMEAPEPQGKIKRAMGKAKKAITSIISNRKQGETKQGSGKG